MPAQAVNRWILKTALRLPSPILRAFSGGASVHRGGRTLDPRFQFLNAVALPPQASLPDTVEEARRAAAQGLALVAGEAESGVRIEDLSIDGPGGPLPLRAYRPAHADPAAPLLVYGHAGGGVIGDLEACHAACSIIAATTRAAVLSVEYRLAPEHRFPAGLEDMVAAWHWARDHAMRFGARSGAAAVGGDSRGANFAAVLCQEMKRIGGPQPALQVLIYPPLDVASETPSMMLYGDGPFASRARRSWMQDNYLGAQADPADPRLSPGRGGDLSGLAPALIAGAGFDPLVDQGLAYAKALMAAGVAVTYRCYDSLPHGFVSYTGAVPAADAAVRQIAQLMREQYDASAAQ
jgi:acetyl esterase/lipase